MKNYRAISYPIMFVALGLMLYGAYIGSTVDLATPANLLPSVAFLLTGFVLEMLAFILWMTGQKQPPKPPVDYSLYQTHDEHSSNLTYNPPPKPPKPPTPKTPFCCVSRAALLTRVSPMTMSMVHRLQADDIYLEPFLGDRSYVQDSRGQRELDKYHQYIEETYLEAYGDDDLPDWLNEEPAYLLDLDVFKPALAPI